MRECVFRSERSWVKRRKPGEAREEPPEHDNPNAAPEGSASFGQPQHIAQRTSSVGYATTPSDPKLVHQPVVMSPPPALRRVSSSQPNLSRSVMRTVVSSGSDALNLLFEAANHRDAMENQEQASVTAYETPRSGTSYGLGKFSISLRSDMGTFKRLRRHIASL